MESHRPPRKSGGLSRGRTQGPLSSCSSNDTWDRGFNIMSHCHTRKVTNRHIEIDKIQEDGEADILTDRQTNRSSGGGGGNCIKVSMYFDNFSLRIHLNTPGFLMLKSRIKPILTKTSSFLGQ